MVTRPTALGKIMAEKRDDVFRLGLRPMSRVRTAYRYQYSAECKIWARAGLANGLAC